MTKPVRSKKLDNFGTNKNYEKRIFDFVARYNLPEKNADILFSVIRTAHERLHYADDFDVVCGLTEKTEKNASSKLATRGKAFLKALEQWESLKIWRGREDDIQDLRVLVKVFIQRAEKIKRYKKRRGKKKNYTWETIIESLALGYCAAFGIKPSFSKQTKEPEKKTKFHHFFDDALKVIAPDIAPIKFSTLGDHWQRWKKTKAGQAALRNPKSIALWFTEIER